MIENYSQKFLVPNNQVQRYSSKVYFYFFHHIAIDYNIEVRTGNQQIQPFDSSVYIQIYGIATATPKLFLESKYESFTKDSIAKFNISSNNVGEVRNRKTNLLFSIPCFFRYKKLLSDMKILVQLMIGI